MEALELLRFQVRETFAWLEMTVADVTEEEANWRPPGVANSIAATYAHLMMSADEDVIGLLQGDAPLLSGEWNGRLGLSEMPPPYFGWQWHDWATRVRVGWQALREYGRAVQARIVTYLRSPTTARLEHSVDMSEWGLKAWSGLEFYNVQGISHPRLHGGEIACLKGIQGREAWPQAWQSGIERPL